MKILMVFPGMVEDLPPILTSSILLSDLGASVKIVCAGCAKKTADSLRAHNVELVHLRLQRYPASLFHKLVLKLRFRRLFFDVLANCPPDVVWFHGVHAMEYCNSNKLKNVIVVAHAHELYSKFSHVQTQNKLIRNASFFIVPEINRGWILRALSGTRKPFFVVPNRLPIEVIPENVENKKITSELFRSAGGSIKCTQFLIYQGYYSPDRCLKELLDGFTRVPHEHIGLILMGDGVDIKYKTELIQLAKKDSRVVILPHIPPPHHLNVTQGCHGGILLYAPTNLNNIYCAPNKLYEYSYYGLGMIMPSYPGLEQINQKYRLAELCDPQDPVSIGEAICRLIETNKESIVRGIRDFLTQSCEPSEAYCIIFTKLLKMVQAGTPSEKNSSIKG